MKPARLPISFQPAVTTLDKIQAELAETRRREEELGRARRQMSRSTPDLTKVLPTGPERTFEHGTDSQSEGEVRGTGQ